MKRCMNMTPAIGQSVRDLEIKLATLLQSVQTTEQKTQQVEQTIRDASSVLEQNKKLNDDRYTSMQGQLHGALSAIGTPGSSGGGGGGAPGRINEALATNRLMNSVKEITGEESYDILDDWYVEVAYNAELLMPGAKTLMN